jgi:trans-2,3-dihydro-3-hydroxyanthranilate isomerase
VDRHDAVAAAREMRAYRFRQVDVFTSRVFGGNPLAVFLDGAGLTAEEMQAIAREMNLSETTFVLPTIRADCVARVRIFTPAREIPFAGHPTIGTAFVLAREGRLPPDRRALEEGVGPVAVELDGDAGMPGFVWMRHQEPEFGPALGDRAVVAGMLGLDETDLLAGAPVQTGSTGSRFLYVPLRDRATVDRAVLDVGTVRRVPETAPVGIFVFAPDADPASGRVYARMFAPHTSGVPEDPATGSASGPLGVYLVRHGLVKGSGRLRIVSEQGTGMGPPSFIHVLVGTAPPYDIRVGGEVVDVLDGVLRLP